MGVRQFASVAVWRLRSRGRILGSGYFIHPAATVRVEPGAVLRLGRGVHVSSRSSVVIQADSVIGPDVFIGRNVSIVALSELRIGAGSLLAENVSIHTENHRGADLSEYSSAPISIGDRCWLCAGAVVVQGAQIGDATVVGANSVVNSPLPAGVVATGVPARAIRTRTDLTDDDRR